jgi:class 3 adenylate cyclase
MARLQRRRFTEPDDVRVIPNGRVDIVELDDRVVGQMTYEPGWRWSVDVKPIAATESCQFHHLGVTLSGRLRVQMRDGIELELLPRDVFEIPPGHDAWVVGEEPWVSVDFEAMRLFARSGPTSARGAVFTILFTDIVDSTAQAVARGPAEWRDLVSRHNESAEKVIGQYGGQLVKTTGDGVIGLFDSAERSIRAAAAMGDAIRGLGVSIRAGVHTGEVELGQGDVRGLAVHAAARIMSTANADDVVASSTVIDLVDGSALRFEDHGLHELKGLPGKRQLYRLVRDGERPPWSPSGAQ